MAFLHRRALLAAPFSLALAWAPRNSRAARLNDLSRLEKSDGTALPPLTFALADGTARTLTDYAGQGVVLNFWATWCVPCVAEMPALSALAAAVKGDGVVVLPASSDRNGAPAVESFYAEHGIGGLPVLLDPKGAAARAAGSRGIPTTLLIDAAGRERGRLEGAADWSSAESLGLIRKLIGPS